MLPSNFQPFVNARPICVLARAPLEPLFDPQQLDELFARTAVKQYTRKLLFSALVEMMVAVVLCVEPSVHAAYRSDTPRSRFPTRPSTTNSKRWNWASPSPWLPTVPRKL